MAIGEAALRSFVALLYYAIISRASHLLPGTRSARAWAANRLCREVDSSANILTGVRLCRELSIGERSGVGAKSTFVGGAPIVLGNRIRMGPECMFLTGTHRIPDHGETFDQSGSSHRPIVVEDDVFVGARVIVLGGVTIGRSAAVGAGSVVTRDVAPFSVVAVSLKNIIRMRDKAPP